MTIEKLRSEIVRSTELRALVDAHMEFYNKFVNEYENAAIGTEFSSALAIMFPSLETLWQSYCLLEREENRRIG